MCIQVEVQTDDFYTKKIKIAEHISLRGYIIIYIEMSGMLIFMFQISNKS